MKLHRSAAFSQLEVIVASSVIALVMLMLSNLTDQTQRLIRSTSGKVEQFQEARAGFDAMTRRLAQATLNTYWEYSYRTEYQTIGGQQQAMRVPDRYQRGSELRFRSGPMVEFTKGKGPNDAWQGTHGVFFQAPNGWVEDPQKYGALDHLLNSWGYFVELGTDAATLPDFLKARMEPRRRFRLMEWREPAEALKVYKYQNPRSTEWFAPQLSKEDRPVRTLVENVVALIITPKFDRTTEAARLQQNKSIILSPSYRYDSTTTNPDPELNQKNQLPPVVQVTMIALDEGSALGLNDRYKTHPTGGIEFGQLFRRPETFDSDLSSFEQQLATTHRVAYRVFTTNVSIRGAKWSITQQN